MKYEMDMLKEVGSIASGHASGALSTILDRKVELLMPSLDILNMETILDKIKISANHNVVSVSSQMLTGIKGNVLFVLEEKGIFDLVNICLPDDDEARSMGLSTERGLTLIKEVGNVIISSYVGTLGMILKKLIVLSIPTLTSGPLDEVMRSAIATFKEEEFVLLLEAVFDVEKQNIKGCFYLILTPPAMDEIQEACIKTLKALEK